MQLCCATPYLGISPPEADKMGLARFRRVLALLLMKVFDQPAAKGADHVRKLIGFKFKILLQLF